MCQERRGRLVQWKNVRFVIFSFGDRGSILAVGFSFQSRFNSQYMVDGTSNTRTRDTHATYRKKLLRHLHCMKENVALKIGSMTSLLILWTVTSYILLRESTTYPATCYNTSSQA